MAKCEHHEDYIRLYDERKVHMDKLEINLIDKINQIERKLERSNDRIESIIEKMSNQNTEHEKTVGYVKTLYDRFDELTRQMERIVSRLDDMVVKVAESHSFSTKGKNLVFEVVKWVTLALLAIGFLNR